MKEGFILKEVEFLFPYQGKMCPIANESCPYKLNCTDCDLYNSLGRVKKLADKMKCDKDVLQNVTKLQVSAS